jgi:hypothetical protein
MAQIKNTFSTGIINKDNDKRFVANGQLLDAENFVVVTTEGNNQGVGKGITGNVQFTDYEEELEIDMTGAKTIGKCVYGAKNRVYNFIKATNFDYIIETNIETQVSAIVAQDVDSGVLNFDANKRITHTEIFETTEEENELLCFGGDNNPPRILNIQYFKSNPTGFTDTEISVMKPAPINAPIITLTNSSDGVLYDFINERFICFSCRYKYRDGFYSAMTGFSEVAFSPNRFSLDFVTMENNGMVNIFNSVDIQFNTGPREVIGIDLLYKESGNSTVYVIEKFLKEEQEWGNDTNVTFTFSKSKIYQVLEDSQYFRLFDNVPLRCESLCSAGNRLMIGNFVEQRNIDNKVTYELSIDATPPILFDFPNEIKNFVAETIVENKYPNVVDFRRQQNILIPDGYVNEMDFQTNVLTLPIDPLEDPIKEYRIDLQITPLSDSEYDVYAVYNGVNTLIGDNVTGEFNYEHSIGGATAPEVTTSSFYVINKSDENLIYNLKLNLKKESFVGDIPYSEVNYYSDYQLSYPNSLTSGFDTHGDTVTESLVDLEFESFDFEINTQIRITFNLRSSYFQGARPTVIFSYILENDFTDLLDFITNSNFINQLEIFSNVFREDFMNGEGFDIATFQGFIVEGVFIGVSSAKLTLRMPLIQYNTEQPAGTGLAIRNEYFLITSVLAGVFGENAFTSMHSNRDVEVGLVYFDAQGRMTTVLVDNDNSIYIPPQNSITQNKIVVTFPNDYVHPNWATHYKFVIKEIKKDYYTILARTFFIEDEFRWIKLDGDNKDKVNENDVLILKVDDRGPITTLRKVKVLEIKTQPKNFITINETDNNTDPNGEEINEPDGVYMKVSANDINLEYEADQFLTDEASGGFKSGRPRESVDLFSVLTDTEIPYDAITNPYIPLQLEEGAIIYLRFSSWRSGYTRATFEEEFVVQQYYETILDWWNDVIVPLGSLPTNTSHTYPIGENPNTDIEEPLVGQYKLWVQGIYSGNGSKSGYIDINVRIQTNTKIICFETEPFEDLSAPYYESVEKYETSDGLLVHTLNKTFNCFAFGNGVESNRIKDSFNAKTFAINNRANNVTEDTYKQINRYADITYSGVLQESTNVNKLNEFNLSLANFKEDIDKSFGPIRRMKGQNTNLEVFQENKCSIIFYGKDILFNADGTSNLSTTEDVLGVQKPYTPEWGISNHPDSFDDYGTNSYITDFKRGVVLRKNDSNGLYPISYYGMRDYFKKLSRENKITHVNGKYDQFHDLYVLNIQYLNSENEAEYVTWLFSEKENGFICRATFNPEDMCRINNEFISFKNGNIWLHNQEQSSYNTFYEVETPSSFEFVFSQEPSVRKNFKAISIEGTDAWDLTMETDLDKGYINKQDFVTKEGVKYAYIRLSNEVIDTSLLSCQGIGNATISGLTLDFTFELDPIISVGDVILNIDKEIVGTVVSKTSTSLTLNAVANIVSGDYVLSSKLQSINNQSMCGYFLKVKATLEKDTATEIYCINTELSQSYP